MSTRIHVFLGQELLERLDGVCGSVPRSAFVRDAVEDAIARQELTAKRRATTDRQVARGGAAEPDVSLDAPKAKVRSPDEPDPLTSEGRRQIRRAREARVQRGD